MRSVLVLFLACVPAVMAFAQSEPAEAAPDAFTAPKPITPEEIKDLAAYWTEGAVESENAAGAQDLFTFDVRDAVKMALEKSAQVFVAQDEVDAARARVGQARSRMLPQLSAQEAVVHMPDLDSGGLGGVLDTLIPIGDMAGDKTKRMDKVTLDQVFYAGGQIRAAINATQYLAESQEWKKQATLNDLEFQTKQACYACMLAKASVRVAGESVKTFERHLGDAEQMLEVGLVSNFEVLRAKTELGSRQASLVAAQNAERLALVNLRRILTLPQDQPVRFLGGDFVQGPAEESVDDLVAAALQNRPELMALERAILAAGQDVKRTKGQFLPSAAGNVEWSNTDGGGSFAMDGWTLTVGAKWDIYAGGRRKHEVGESKSRLSGLEHQRDDVRRLIELDVRQAHIQMQDALAKIREQKGTVELGREGQRLAELRFEEGVGTQSDTLDAELALTAAETGLVRALYEYAVALAAIEKATGRTWAVAPETSETP